MADESINQSNIFAEDTTGTFDDERYSLEFLQKE